MTAKRMAASIKVRPRKWIKWMPAYKSGDPRIIEHYMTALACDSKQAAGIFHQDCNHYRRAPEESRIQYDQTTDTWRGREVGLPGAMFGIRRRNDNPASLRNAIEDAIGNRYLGREALLALAVSLFGAEKAESKLKQARSKKFIRFTHPLWHFWTTPPPPSEVIEAETAALNCSKYAQLYGAMPRLKHRPGDAYRPEDSQVLQWMSEKSGSTDFQWLEKELRRARQAGAIKFDNDIESRDSFGILTWQAEQEKLPKAKAPVEQAAPVVPTAPVVPDDRYDHEHGDGPQKGNSYFHPIDTYIPLVDGGYDSGGDEFWIGEPGSRKMMSEKAKYDFERMPSMHESEAEKWLVKKIGFNFDAKRLVRELMASGRLIRDGNRLKADPDLI